MVGGMRGGGACIAGGVALWKGACMAMARGCAWRGGGGACVAGDTATAADGTHPTEMHFSVC